MERQHRHHQLPQTIEEERREATGKRLNILFILTFVALSVLIGRLSFVQLARGDYFLKRAETNRYIVQTVPAPRGQIFDRDGHLLVTNTPAFAITFTILSEKVQKPQQIAAHLAPVLGKPPADVLQLMDLEGKRYMYTMARQLVTNASNEQVAYIKEHQSELPGVNVVVAPIRQYRYGHFASHVLGYLNNIPHDVWAKHQDEYEQNDVIGRAGVESAYEAELRGKKGMLQVEVNINNQPVGNQRIDEPVKGNDLVLTLDHRLQEATERALAARVQDLHRKTKSVEHAAAVALDPKTGEVLAMASYPDYDPNIWIGGLSDKEYEEFRPAEMNRAIQQVYQPGSTVKMATSLIGMKEGVIRPRTVIHDPGKIQVGYLTNGKPNYIKSWKAIGYPDLYRALAESSNVYMIKTFLDLAKYREDMPTAQVNHFLTHNLPTAMNKILAYHQELGLGETRTGLDLPYEEAGIVTQEKFVSDLAFAAIGQTESYTMMQLAQYVATIANNGQRVQPHVLREVRGPNGESIKKIAPVTQNKTSFTPEQLQAVQRGMREVVQKPYGTFHGVFGSYPVAVAGKTGTAETGRGTEHSLFVGYAPYNDPKIAIAIIVPENEKGKSTSETVGPIARSMLDAYFQR